MNKKKEITMYSSSFFRFLKGWNFLNSVACWRLASSHHVTQQRSVPVCSFKNQRMGDTFWQNHVSAAAVLKVAEFIDFVRFNLNFENRNLFRLTLRWRIWFLVHSFWFTRTSNTITSLLDHRCKLLPHRHFKNEDVFIEMSCLTV